MQIVKTLVTFDDEQDLYHADTIEYDGQMWLVPEWVEATAGGWKRPRRIICLNAMPHERVDGNSADLFVLSLPIPRCVFDGQIPQDSRTRYVIVENPDIRVPVGAARS